MEKYFFTSESVTEGHPDKICDYIADVILDECLKQDKDSKVAVEVMASKNIIIITGQINTSAKVKIESVVKSKIRDIGYDNHLTDLDYKTCKIVTNITKQSIDIANLVKDNGAGDQGTIFGFACNETENYMPLSLDFAHNLAKKLTLARKENIIQGLRPDGKTQVTIEYVDNKPIRAESIIVSTQHIKGKNLKSLRSDILENIILTSKYSKLIDKNTQININERGEFIYGGPFADTGVTGRKLIVDTYGGHSKHGGGAMSGKDASKVDRSAAYMLRHIAKSIVASSLADKIEIGASYAIGQEEPVAIYINTFNTNKISEQEIIKIIKQKFDLTPKAMIEYLKLKEPIYSKTTNYGHFGKENLPWERIVRL